MWEIDATLWLVAQSLPRFFGPLINGAALDVLLPRNFGVRRSSQRVERERAIERSFAKRSVDLERSSRLRQRVGRVGFTAATLSPLQIRGGKITPNERGVWSFFGGLLQHSDRLIEIAHHEIRGGQRPPKAEFLLSSHALLNGCHDDLEVQRCLWITPPSRPRRSSSVLESARQSPFEWPRRLLLQRSDQLLQLRTVARTEPEPLRARDVDREREDRGCCERGSHTRHVSRGLKGKHRRRAAGRLLLRREKIHRVDDDNPAVVTGHEVLLDFHTIDIGQHALGVRGKLLRVWMLIERRLVSTRMRRTRRPVSESHGLPQDRRPQLQISDGRSPS